MTTLPRAAARSGRWAAVLLVTAVVLFSVALVDRIHCRLSGCTGVAEHRLLDLDAVDGLPRLFTTGLFAAFAVVAGITTARARGRVRIWWATVTFGGVLLAVAKLTSVHSTAKADNGLVTLVLGVALAGVALALLWTLARRWGVAAGAPLVLALAVYALAALGLDELTGLAATLTGRTGAVADSLATYVEELGEALAALAVLVTAFAWRPPRER